MCLLEVILLVTSILLTLYDDGDVGKCTCVHKYLDISCVFLSVRG